MEERKRLSKGTRRHIRDLKADIRRSFGYTPEADLKLKDIYEKFFIKIVSEKPKAEVVIATREKPKEEKPAQAKKSHPRPRKAAK